MDKHVMELLVNGDAATMARLLNLRRFDAVRELVKAWNGNYLAAVLCVVIQDDDGNWIVHDSSS